MAAKKALHRFCDTFLFISLAGLLGCGGGGGSSGSGGASSTNAVSLEQGGFHVQVITTDAEARFRIEGCPPLVCSTDLVGYNEVSRTAQLAITFSTTNETAPGTFNIRLISYTGGQSCFGGLCNTSPQETLKQWNIRLEITAGGFHFRREETRVASGPPVSIQLIDMNQDERQDVLILSTEPYQHSRASYFPVQDNGSLGGEVILVETPQATTGMTAGDLNGDGVPELIFGYPFRAGEPGGIYVYQKMGGTWRLARQLGLAHPDNVVYSIFYPQIIDMDLDGDWEVVAGVRWNSNRGGAVVVVDDILGQPDFSLYEHSNDAQFINGLEVVDINSDGWLDAVVVAGLGSINYGYEASIEVLYGAADGTLGAQFESYRNLSASPSSLLVPDINEDGIPDLLLGMGKSVEVRLGLGEGRFSLPDNIEIDRRAGRLAIGDINGDGMPDLLAVGSISIFPTSASSPVLIMINDGVGSFRAPSAVATTGRPNDVALADFDGDGLMDFVTISANLGIVTQYFQ